MNVAGVLMVPSRALGIGRWAVALTALVTLALVLAQAPLPAALGLVAGVIAFLAVLAQPLVGLALLVLAIPFGSPFNVQVGGFNFGLTEMLFGLMALAWLGQCVIARDLSNGLWRATQAVDRTDAVAVGIDLGAAPLSGDVRQNPLVTAAGRINSILPVIAWPLAAWLFVLALTLLVTHSLPESLKEMIKWGEVLFVVMYVATRIERRHIPWLLALTFVAAAGEAAIGLVQTVTRNGPDPFFVPLGGQLVMRSYGTFEQPNPFAAYLNLTLPLIVSLLVGYLFERSAWRVPKPMPAGPRSASSAQAFRSARGIRPAAQGLAFHAAEQDSGGGLTSRSARTQLHTLSPQALCLVALLSLPLVAAAFFFSLSRGAWMGFALAFVVITAFRSQRTLMLFVLLSIVLSGTLILGSLNILPSAITDRIADIPAFFGLNLFDPRAVLLTNDNFGIVDRMAHWFAAWGMFSANPWLGVGIGNYGVVYPLYGLREWPFSLGHAHNFYLNMLAETGIVGFSTYCVLVASALLYAWMAARRARGMWRALALGILGALIALSAHNFFDNLYVHGMNIQFALLLGMAARVAGPDA
jgi:putative inorganic carbon (hco3(-)) transporter